MRVSPSMTTSPVVSSVPSVHVRVRVCGSSGTTEKRWQRVYHRALCKFDLSFIVIPEAIQRQRSKTTVTLL